MAASIAHYYANQSGGSLHSIGHIYRSPQSRYQRGYGIGSFLANVYRVLRPFALQGLNSLSEQSLKTSKNIVQDLKDNKPLSEIVRNRSKEAVLDLTEQGIDGLRKKMGKRQSGSGINRRSKSRRRTIGGRRPRKSKQIGGRRTKRKTKRRSKKKRVLDIFT